MIGQSFFQRNQTILNAKIQQGFIRHLREETYNALLQANWGFFLRKRKSDIINLMTTELDVLAGGTNLFFTIYYLDLFLHSFKLGLHFGFLQR